MMRTIEGENLSALTPLTPLNSDEAVHYVRCNLTNRLVHPDSTMDHCQISQILFRAEGEPVWIGRGVRGEITAADVQAVVATMGGEG